MYAVRRCDPELLRRDLHGKTYVITGANSGIGLETARQLVAMGGHVVLACRSVERASEVASALAGLPGTTDVVHLDLANLNSVRSAAHEILEQCPRIDGLVNNAGVMLPPLTRTAQGFELQFGTNHLGHYLLTELLLERLQASAPARIVILSSVAHAGMWSATPTLHFDDLQWESRPYDRTMAYGESKLANVLHARILADRLEGSGVTPVSVHPGWARSNLVRHAAPPFVQNVLMAPLGWFLTMMSNSDGAQTTLHCLLDDDVAAHPGAYYSQNSLLYTNKHDRSGGWPMASPNPAAYDPAVAAQLDKVSRELVGL